MRKLLFLFLSLFPLTVSATSYTVKSGGGGSFTTIQACATAAVAGDVCTVFAGTYNETVTPAHSGSAGNPIKIQVNAGDCVTMHGFSLGNLSYITIGNPPGANCTSGGVTFPGFQIMTHAITLSSVNNVIIQGNYINNVGDICIHGPGTIAQGTATFVYILNNILTACGGPGGLAGGIGMEGNHWLVDGNTISHVEDGMYAYGSFIVIRNNVFGPINQAEQGSNHPDGIESTCTNGSDYPLQHMLFEENTIQNWIDTDGHGLLLRDTQSCGQTQNVVRFNQVYNLGADFISNDVNSTKELVYNNSLSQIEVSFSPKEFSSLVFTNGDTGAQVINNIQQDSWRPGNSDFCIYVDGTSTSGFGEHNNLCFLTGWSGSWQTGSQGAYSGTDIFNSDPKYVSTTSDLHLQAGSPAIGAGGPLTTAVGNGVNSTALTVANAGFFSDGAGITGVQADWVRIGASTTAQIASINYSTNVITLAGTQSWSNGASVYLYKNSNGTVVLNAASPNIGFDQGSSVSPVFKPTNLRVIIVQ